MPNAWTMIFCLLRMSGLSRARFQDGMHVQRLLGHRDVRNQGFCPSSGFKLLIAGSSPQARRAARQTTQAGTQLQTNGYEQSTAGYIGGSATMAPLPNVHGTIGKIEPLLDSSLLARFADLPQEGVALPAS
jgi:hypothetical protein